MVGYGIYISIVDVYTRMYTDVHPCICHSAPKSTDKTHGLGIKVKESVRDVLFENR
jgi:hypothetical protein